jgi:hypothetical protein
MTTQDDRGFLPIGRYFYSFFLGIGIGDRVRVVSRKSRDVLDEMRWVRNDATFSRNSLCCQSKISCDLVEGQSVDGL